MSENDKAMMDSFLKEKDENEKKLILDFAKQLVALDMEIKGIKDDQKEIKKEAKDEGLLIKEITAAINDIKKEIKQPASEAADESAIGIILREDTDFYNAVELLVQ